MTKMKFKIAMFLLVSSVLFLTTQTISTLEENAIENEEKQQQIELSDEELDAFEQVDLLLTFGCKTPTDHAQFASKAIDLLRSAKLLLKRRELRAESSESGLIRGFALDLVGNLVELFDLVGYNYEWNILDSLAIELKRKLNFVRVKRAKEFERLHILLHALVVGMEKKSWPKKLAAKKEADEAKENEKKTKNKEE